MVDAVVAELDFYLVKLGESDSWGYARYHCGTTSNLYGTVRWSFHSGHPFSLPPRFSMGHLPPQMAERQHPVLPKPHLDTSCLVLSATIQPVIRKQRGTADIGAVGSP